ncbi:MAG: polysaccharide deacetylase family protein [Ginsengibacter sp.]
MLLIYITENSERCQYVFELIFKQDFGIEYRVTTDLNVFNTYAQEKINYSNARIGDSFFIKATPLLFEKEIKQQHITVTQIMDSQKEQVKVLFANENCDLGFDIFSSVFYMVSRYEEYSPFTPDDDGRFKASDSLAFKNDFLQIPVVNIWSDILKNRMGEMFPSLGTKNSLFNALLTYDIDVAYKFKGRSIVRTLGSIAKDILNLRLKNICQRFITLLNFQKDPWDTYKYLSEASTSADLKMVFFFLMADKSANDRNLDYSNPWMKRLIRNVMQHSNIGIHPSYSTTEFPEKIEIEKKRLERICGEQIIKSRQHYLKFRLPGTYCSLIAAGITEEYSMGFSEMPGFRAGTCKPFYFYDLKKEKVAFLKIFPVTLMESSFMESKTDLEQSLQQILNLIREVRKVQGTFVSIWHNHTVSDTSEYKAWKRIHEKMILAVQ